MNFAKKFTEGQKDGSLGLPMGKGLRAISRVINGIRRSMIYSIAAASKVGKSTYVDVGFVIEPCLYILEMMKQGKENIPDLHIIYLSYEIDRVSKEFDFASHFMSRDYGITEVDLPEGKLYQEKTFVPISAEYLMGQLVYDSEDENEREKIKVTKEIEEKLLIIYKERIIPLFGKYDAEGKRLEKGLITVIEDRDNPTGIRNNLIAYAESKGKILYNESRTKNGKLIKRMKGYVPNNLNSFTLVVADHIRKLIPERNFNLKQTIDKYSEYTVEFRNLFGFSFVNIIHLNRGMTDVQRRRLDEDNIYPSSNDIKDSGNLSEDSNYVFTMFNPNDDKYNLDKHFETVIRTGNGSLKYPNLRTIHLVESRHCFAPQHFGVIMDGATKTFTKFQKK